MSHTAQSSRGTPQLEPFDDPEPGSTWFVSLAGVVILVALVIFISAVTFRTEHHEFDRKVVDRSLGAAPAIPTAPLDAASARTLERDLSLKRDEGLIGLAEYNKLSQGVILNSWMRYPWEDAKGATKQLIRIPITEAMSIVAKEYEAKPGAKRVAAADAAASQPAGAQGPAPAPSESDRTGAMP
ncbi:MAG: hypothetical protein FJ253_01915 [Phycisphaerae bacterium]|nr:hypothetical protein [Phycisphaerae bacterium]